MIGTFKPKDREDRWKTLLITTSADNAFAHYLNAHGCFIDARQIGDQTYYQVYETSTTRRDETEHPLYNMIVEMEAIEVHRLNKIIEEHGGTVLDFNTDCVSCVFENDKCPFELDGINLKNYHYDDEGLCPK